MIKALGLMQMAECISSWLSWKDIHSAKLVSKLWSINLKYIKIPSAAEVLAYYECCDEKSKTKKENKKIRLYSYKAV